MQQSKKPGKQESKKPATKTVTLTGSPEKIDKFLKWQRFWFKRHGITVK